MPAADDPVDLDVAQVDERKCQPHPPRIRPAINRARSRRGADGGSSFWLGTTFGSRLLSKQALCT